MNYEFEFSLWDILCIAWELFLNVCGGMVTTAVVCTLANIPMEGWSALVMIGCASVICWIITGVVAEKIEEEEKEDDDK